GGTLDPQGQPRQSCGRQAEHRDSLDAVNVNYWPDHVEEASHDVDLYVALLEHVNSLRLAFSGDLPCDDYPLDVPLEEHLGKLCQRPEIRQVGHGTGGSRWGLVDEPEQVEAVFRVLEELTGHEKAEIVGTEDDRVLDERRRAMAKLARRRAPEDDENDREHPEGEHLGVARFREAGHPRPTLEEPEADRDRVEDRDRVVGRGV